MILPFPASVFAECFWPHFHGVQEPPEKLRTDREMICDLVVGLRLGGDSPEDSLHGLLAGEVGAADGGVASWPGLGTVDVGAVVVGWGVLFSVAGGVLGVAGALPGVGGVVGGTAAGVVVLLGAGVGVPGAAGVSVLGVVAGAVPEAGAAAAGALGSGVPGSVATTGGGSGFLKGSSHVTQ